MYQLQNRYMTFKQQLNTKALLPEPIKQEEMNTSQPEDNSPTRTRDSSKVTVISTPLNLFKVTPNLNQIKLYSTTLKSCHTGPSSNSRNTITDALSTEAKKAAD